MGFGSFKTSGNIAGIRNKQFFDRPAVTGALDRKTVRVMARLGGFVRVVMQRSMRKRKGPSKPGSPPNAHIGTLRALTEFGYDAQDKSLVVGPHKIDSPTIPVGGGTVAELLNQGGDALVYALGGRSVKAHFSPRPFTDPALDKGITKFRDELATVPFTARGR